jgi:hypothetical protein
MTPDRDRATDPGPLRSDQALLDDLRRLEAALGDGAHENLNAPDRSGRESDADAA